MASRDILLEAKNVSDSLAKRIDERILSKSAELKPRTVSIAERIRDVSSAISRILVRLAEITGEEDKKIVNAGRWLYVVFYKDGFAAVRSKPYTMTISYVKGEGRLLVRTRRFEAVVTPSTLGLKYMSMSIQVDPGSVREIEDYQGELKYLLRKLGKIIEYQILPVVEARVAHAG